MINMINKLCKILPPYVLSSLLCHSADDACGHSLSVQPVCACNSGVAPCEAEVVLGKGPGESTDMTVADNYPSTASNQTISAAPVRGWPRQV